MKRKTLKKQRRLALATKKQRRLAFATRQVRKFLLDSMVSAEELAASMMIARCNRDFNDEMFRLIEKYGKTYEPAVLPSDIQRGAPGDCYDHCMFQAARSMFGIDNDLDIGPHKYRYVEGYAVATNGALRAHAWLTDGVHAFDPTWLFLDQGIERPMPGPYKGIEIDIEDLASFISVVEMKSVLHNRMSNPLLASIALDIPLMEIVTNGKA